MTRTHTHTCMLLHTNTLSENTSSDQNNTHTHTHQRSANLHAAHTPTQTPITHCNQADESPPSDVCCLRIEARQTFPHIVYDPLSKPLPFQHFHCQTHILHSFPLRLLNPLFKLDNIRIRYPTLLYVIPCTLYL